MVDKGTGKGFGLSASVFHVSTDPTNALHTWSLIIERGEQWSCWRPQFRRTHYNAIARIKASEGFKERN